MSTAHLDDVTILSRRQQSELLGVSDVTLWRLRDELPPEVQISRGVRGRRLSELKQFLDARTIERGSSAQPRQFQDHQRRQKGEAPDGSLAGRR